MREVEICQAKRGPTAITRLEFAPDGSALIATAQRRLHAYDLRANRASLLFEDDILDGWDYWSDGEPQLLVSPDHRFVAYEFDAEPIGEEARRVVFFNDLVYRNEHLGLPPYLCIEGDGDSALVFTPNGKELI